MRTAAASLAAITWILVAAPGCRDGIVRQTIADHPGSFATAEGVLGPMDVIEIRVYDEPEMSHDYRVDADGTITFPFLGAVRVSGLTPNEAGIVLADRLSVGFLVNPVITVLVKESNSRQVFVLGQVAKPGPYPYTDGMTIVEALALAGGVTEDAAPNRTRVTRLADGVEATFTVKIMAISAGQESNILLQPNDRIYIPVSPI